MRVFALVLMAVCASSGGLSAQVIFSDGFESGDVWMWSSAVGWRVCDVFTQYCEFSESCYLLLRLEHQPTACAQAVPEPDPPSGCGSGLSRPGWQDECCSYDNTCDTGLGCILGDMPSVSHFVCGMFCDPTGTVGQDNCFADLGPAFHCLKIRSYWSDLPDLEEYFGFCIDGAIWGPPECWNKIQDPDEDGVDCCLTSGGNPNCECVFDCP